MSMRLDQLSKSEVISLVGGQAHRIYQDLNQMLGRGGDEVTDTQVREILQFLQKDLNRLLDLIEGVLPPASEGTVQ